MKRVHLLIGLGMVSAGITMFGARHALAAANAWSPYFQIGYLDNDDAGNKDTLTVGNAGGSIPANPANCSQTTYASQLSTASAASKDEMNKVLLSAFLAGRKVRLRLSGTVCQGNSPAFYAVSLDSTQ